jgi:serine/threonine protein kinase
MSLGAAGERFGRYQLGELIGQGGMAEVFRATTAGRRADGPGFVIKRIRPDRSDSPRFVEMFCDEARISALLDHPNIVRVFDFGQIDGAYFMAMEYLDGKDLAAVLRALRGRRAAMPPPVAALVTREVARALEHAHDATLPTGEPGGIVHRDVSPSNVMLLWSGGVKILDFGIAKAAALARPSDEAAAGKPPKLQGHLGYLSPEQIRGAEVDRRSDLFSLGVVLWEMLAGQHLFAGHDEYETMRNVLLRPVPALGGGASWIPPALAAIVARALERDPARRYATAGALADDLDGFLAAVPCPKAAVTALLGQLYGENDADPAPAATQGRRGAIAAVAGGTLVAALLGALLGRGACGGAAAATPAQSSSARSVSTSR